MSLTTSNFDVAVVGGGPAGLAAAHAASQSGASVALVEREARLGGILKQCVHDGFGLVRYGQKLSGPEYAQRDIAALSQTAVAVKTLHFVASIERESGGFCLELIHRGGVELLRCRALVLATGCRERTAKQVAIHGGRPAGVFTAGAAQYYVNVLGQLPARRCVVLGSGDIGLIMARRLTLEGAEVLGVFEAKARPSGLARNIAQCLDDFGIPLALGHTVTRALGRERLEAVEVAAVDDALCPIAGTERIIECDGLILSVGLIPENELARSLGLELSPVSGGPPVDQTGMTALPGLYSCGNALLVNDLVDYVSETAARAGAAAARYAERPQSPVSVELGAGLGLVAPQRVDLLGPIDEVVFFLRSAAERNNARLTVTAGGQVVFSKRYRALRPPEMQRLALPVGQWNLAAGDSLRFALEDER